MGPTGLAVKVSGTVLETPLNADPQRLQQIIWNLLSNAVKYTQRGGTVALQLSTYDDQLQIEVVDNGRGIAPEYLRICGAASHKLIRALRGAPAVSAWVFRSSSI